MIRLARVLLVTLLLGPQVGLVVLPIEPACQEERDCCEPDSGCDVSCVQCACCASRIPTLSSPSTIDPFAAGSRTPAVAAVAAPPQPAPDDILHVPKTV